MDCRNVFVVLALFSVLADAGFEWGYMQIKVTGLNDPLVTTRAMYITLTTHFPRGVSNVTERDWHKAIDVYQQTGCPTLRSFNANGKYVFIGAEQCSSSDVDRLFAVSKAYGLVFVNDALNISSRKPYNAAVISKNSYDRFVSLKKSYTEKKLSVSMYKSAPVKLSNVPVENLIVLWLLAFSATAYGTWWNGYEIRELINANPIYPKPSKQRGDKFACIECGLGFIVLFIPSFITTVISIKILAFSCVYKQCVDVGFCADMIFFWNLVTYVIFYIITSVTLFLILFFFAKRFSCTETYKVLVNNIPLLKKHAPIAGICLYLVCAIFSSMWAVYKKAWFFWIMHDILSFTFCVVVIKWNIIRSYKGSIINNISFLIISIAFAYGTPSNPNCNKSVMEQAATRQHDSVDDVSRFIISECEEDYVSSSMCLPKEKVPLFFLIPYINDVLKNRFVFLGFGEVIIPGWHLGFCVAWDVRRSAQQLGKVHVYFLAALASYGFGLLLTFVAISVTKTAQPPLLYLVPCCLLSTLVVGWRKQELKALWAGISSKEISNFIPLEEENENASNEVSIEKFSHEVSIENASSEVMNENANDEVSNESASNEVSNEKASLEVSIENASGKVFNKHAYDRVSNEKASNLVSDIFEQEVQHISVENTGNDV